MKVIIEADGGSRGNPGVAGSGIVLFDATHTTILRRLAYIVGTATNNVAEYHALLNGLTAARELGATEVDVLMDSKLVVEQMSGRWKIKHPDMKELARTCRDIASGFASITYTWIPRKQNARADELANKAMDALAQGAQPGFLDLGGDSPSATSHTEPTAKKDDCAGDQHATAPKTWNGATTDATRFLLLRHGQTPMSAARQYSGLSNPSLSELGRYQAERAAQYLASRGGIDVIVSSPLKRCQETATAAARALGMNDIRTVDDLKEMDFGQWDGLTFSQAHDSDPELHQQWLADPKIAPPGGEALVQAHRRIKRVREELQREYGEATILVVSHVTPIKSILRQALEAPAGMFHRMHLDLASLSIAEFYSDGPTCVRLVNDTSYLR
ncbi:bifunctional RNase H/acid phosphatase [Corynebacterium silvaticum]|uniref:Bifunctional RNase H/acid phosphatase n=1 Tax=Corynebacterium silvaticum TaxID=2320431 RepID=A0A7Y4LFM9_9CORY|nr:bifunctional RNase H/acid phosphatase [Corynebacterium silvaticum]ARU46522.1 bifunctional RNase H/acid phosphatase [Corynebacterium silvaticum]NON69215.1 bifunctional RNase H/acid phosphatase [Corynebacterium silvaticum]UWG99744.1 bifunctional RNase H/acid phosphatase [Corynebacterium silvaticum]UWH01791.1 bifunctional RNase H/acid phosphatase [Corynebacterium silvaticum]UWH03828.1 bifunctional RNase H/acid phosphatase [Corynebacterium silvaticum]